MEDNFSMDREEWEWFGDDSNTLHSLCTLFLLLLHQLHLRLLGIRFWRLGTLKKKVCGSQGTESLLFPFQVRVINEELYRKTLEEIVRSLDKMENANIPSVSLSKREVERM